MVWSKGRAATSGKSILPPRAPKTGHDKKMCERAGFYPERLSTLIFRHVKTSHITAALGELWLRSLPTAQPLCILGQDQPWYAEQATEICQMASGAAGLYPWIELASPRSRRATLSDPRWPPPPLLPWPRAISTAAAPLAELPVSVQRHIDASETECACPWLSLVRFLLFGAFWRRHKIHMDSTYLRFYVHPIAQSLCVWSFVCMTVEQFTRIWVYVTRISDFGYFQLSRLRGFYFTTFRCRRAMVHGTGVGIIQQNGQDLAFIKNFS